MQIVIVGPGALGCLFGAALSKGGHNVTLLGRPTAHFEALRNQGLRLEALDGTIEQVSIAVTHDPAVASDAEALIVLVKVPDTGAAMNAIRPYVYTGQVVLTLQNGLGNTETIRSVLGPQPQVLPGVTFQAATRRAPGWVKHAGEGPTLIGLSNKRDNVVAAEFARAFVDAGLPAASVPDIDRWIWQKIAVNAAINGLTALGSFPNGVIATDPKLLDAAETIAEEAASVARENGIELGGMRRIISEIATATKDNRSSMLQDLDAGRPTEVAAIHEAVLAAGEEAGIELPATRLVAALIRAKERAASAGERSDGN